VRFPNDKIIEAEARHLSLNSSTLVNDASLPLFFLDRKNVVVDVEVFFEYNIFGFLSSDLS